MPLLLLDLDNTLVDRDAAFRTAVADFLAQHGLPDSDLTRVTTIDASGYTALHEVASALTDRYGDAVPTTAVRALLDNGVADHVVLAHSSREALSETQDDGWTCVTVTNGPQCRRRSTAFRPWTAAPPAPCQCRCPGPLVGDPGAELETPLLLVTAVSVDGDGFDVLARHTDVPVTLEVLPGGGQVHDPFLALAGAWLQILVRAAGSIPSTCLHIHGRPPPSCSYPGLTDASHRPRSSPRRTTLPATVDRVPPASGCHFVRGEERCHATGHAGHQDGGRCRVNPRRPLGSRGTSTPQYPLSRWAVTRPVRPPARLWRRS